MKIVVLGTRGFPGLQGGVEKHCENLYPLMAQKGCEVTVLARKPYVGEKSYTHKGVLIRPVACPKSKFFEAFVHTFKGVFAAAKIKPDILHIHAIGPSLCVPLAKLLGLRVVMTHHGPDYERAKWNRLAGLILRLGEALGCRNADAVIAISAGIARSVKEKFGREATVIANGVNPAESLESGETLKKFGLEKGKYVLAVGRFVPEKGFDVLMEAFGTASAPRNDGPAMETAPSAWKLAIAGGADHEDKYSLGLKQKAKSNANIVLTGFLSGKPLAELYSHAGLFVLPSSYEGLPIALLEAMSYGLSCIVSDIPANREVGLNEDRYFRAGGVGPLASKIIKFINHPMGEEERKGQISAIAEKYNWDKIANQTLGVYKKIVNQ